MREHLLQTYMGSKTSPVWTDLWSLAVGVDFRLGQAKTEGELFQILAVDDFVEVSLRRLAAYTYENRTGDRVGANTMLAVVPPGTQRDIAPTWMVDTATAHSKQDFQRTERVATAQKRGKGKGKDSESKGGGKGRKGKPAAAQEE